jgi:hypothetical protein
VQLKAALVVAFSVNKEYLWHRQRQFFRQFGQVLQVYSQVAERLRQEVPLRAARQQVVQRQEQQAQVRLRLAEQARALAYSVALVEA